MIVKPSQRFVRSSTRYTVNIGPDNKNHGDMEQSQPRSCSNTIQLSRVFVSSAQNMLYLHVGGGEIFYV